MATTETAHRSDLHHSKYQSDLETSRSPYPSAHHQARRGSTPRPSISPLSSASRTGRSSPYPMATTTIERSRVQQLKSTLDDTDSLAESADNSEDASSELSEPDDEDEEMADADGSAVALNTRMARNTAGAQDDDSEAETERLDQTPHKQRKLIDGLGRTPSKLSQPVIDEDELSDPPSPLTKGPGAASSTSTVDTAGKKRKRSETADSSVTSENSDAEQSPRKRGHSSNADAQIRAEDDAAAAAIMGDRAAAAIEDENSAPNEDNETPTLSQARGKGKKGKQKGKRQKEQAEELEPETVEESVETTEEQSEQDAVKTAEDEKNQAEALAMFTEVANQFMAFKEKMYHERIAVLDAELKMLNQPPCQHPEYLRQVSCVNARLEKQQREAQAYYNYKQRSIRQRTLGERSQLHSQYFQSIRERREESLYAMGEDWYNIQKERRQSSRGQDDQYLYRFTTKKSKQIQNKAKYNLEVSVLAGLAKYVGFPAAPEIEGAVDGLEEDLKAMKIPKRIPQAAPQPRAYQFKPASIPPAPTSERAAHEHFFEQNAWARPQAPIHAHGTPNLTHTPDWAEPAGGSSAKHIMRNLSGVQRTGSPFTTPLPQRRPPQDMSSSGTLPIGSDGLEPPSSLQPMPPSTDRLGPPQVHGSSQPASPLNVLKHRTHTNGTGERELTGFRNISNISGASTIDTPIHTTQSLGIDIDRSRSQNPTPKSLPATLPHQIFETSHLQRMTGLSDVLKKPVDSPFGRGASVHHGTFRASDGAFGTPAPLTALPRPTSVPAASSASTGAAAGGNAS